MQRAAELGGLAGLGVMGRSRSAPAETLRSYAASYAASLLHQVCQGPALQPKPPSSWRHSCMPQQVHQGSKVPGLPTGALRVWLF